MSLRPYSKTEIARLYFPNTHTFTGDPKVLTHIKAKDCNTPINSVTALIGISDTTLPRYILV